MIKRIKKILEWKKITASQLAQVLGVQPSSVSHILSGRNKPSLDFVQKILNSYPEISSDWLLFGKGNMIISKSKTLFDDHNDLDLKDREDDKSDVTGVNILDKQRELNFTDVKNLSSVNETEKSKKHTVTDNDEQKTKAGSDRVPARGNKRKAKTVLILYNDNSFEEYSSDAN